MGPQLGTNNRSDVKEPHFCGFEDNRRPRCGQGEGLLTEQAGRFQYLFEPCEESGAQRAIDDAVIGGQRQG